MSVSFPVAGASATSPQAEVPKPEPEQPVPEHPASEHAAQVSAPALCAEPGLPMTGLPVTGLAVYVDVDETLLRHYGTRQIPIPSVIKQVKALHKQGAELYCWSSMGAVYARQCAETCGIAHCFQAFLPKPQVIVDDQQPRAWRKILHVHPSQCSSQTTVQEYREELKKPRSL